MNFRSVKIIGLQRSGTNWLTQLVKANFIVNVYEDPIQPFFKHALPEEKKIILYSSNKTVETAVPKEYILSHQDELFILVYKPIDFWIRSIQKNRADLQQKQSELFNQKNKLIQSKAEKYWLKYMKEWSDLKSPNLKIWPYLTILEDYKIFLMPLYYKFEIQPKKSTWTNVKNVPQSKIFTQTNRQKYLT